MTVEPSLRDEMLAALPSLRAFALSLSNDPVLADDLVQETILRAWANTYRFAPGTNLQAWLFTILRNVLLSEWRKRKREVEDGDGSYAATLRAYPDQQDHLDVDDLRAALAKLRLDQREALLLVAAQGLSYEEAAAVCGVPVGTIKSRVNRARHRLPELLGLDGAPDLGPDNVTKAALASLSLGSPA
ncbi:sigma-70 family RNA polymerase sigma factor [Microvirga massiliensis]|uniref:sigma-70 family RNA polymerase sigma factor n=1 Tax=Microvirga massiliensis TaxID=1033741 RepID=UPI00062B7F36|nr:sigma-70 family RNA polymerase sigma factor [Microvirga massiliensis]